MNKNLKRCPVCKGKGVVDRIYPPDTPEFVKEAKFPRESCGPCNGTGIVTKEKVRSRKWEKNKQSA